MLTKFVLERNWCTIKTYKVYDVNQIDSCTIDDNVDFVHPH